VVFSSLIFIVGFLPIALVGFWALSHVGTRAARVWLCLASLVFYGWWFVGWTPVLLLSIATNFMIARAIMATNGEATKRWLVWGGVALNLAALFHFKYLYGLASSLGLAQAIGFGSQAPELPLGISFFTFTQIAFLIDVGQGFAAEYRFLNYFLFVTFFPHLIAGPIVHHKDLMPQFANPRTYRFQPRDFAVGLTIFVFGLAKKTIVADKLSVVSHNAFGLEHAGLTGAWVGALAYSMQLYFDFSGYSDMAIGLARMFGVKFPLNFNSPYKATNIINFWQRWHMTLTRFLTAYVYNPMALHIVRKRVAAGLSTSKTASRTLSGFLQLIALPTIVTMTLAGVWHGAGLQFVIFGVLHGFYISINHAWRVFGPKRARDDTPSRLAVVGQGCLVYLGVLVAQIFFGAASTADAFGTLGHMLGFDGLGRLDLIPRGDALKLIGAMALVWLAPNTQEIIGDFEPALDAVAARRPSPARMRLDPTWAVLCAAMLYIGMMNIVEDQPFIYFQF
jgi:alginate O-acetyltransferase complex protein AlgI